MTFFALKLKLASDDKVNILNAAAYALEKEHMGHMRGKISVSCTDILQTVMALMLVTRQTYLQAHLRENAVKKV